MPDDIRTTMLEKWRTLEKPAAVNRNRAKFADMEDGFWTLYDQVHEYTLTSVERLYDLYKSVEYVVRASVPGAIVECGVWRGGSMMMVALALQQFGDVSRTLMLYDTFEGLPYPTSDYDVDLIGNHAADRWREGWIKVPEDDVAANMESTGYPGAIQYIRGMVEDTLPRIADENWPIAIARLDTDWEASTAVELEVLWPRISLGGFAVVDDYGHWQGARKATDEYFADKVVKMNRVDYTGRTIQKVW